VKLSALRDWLRGKQQEGDVCKATSQLLWQWVGRTSATLLKAACEQRGVGPDALVEQLDLAAIGGAVRLAQRMLDEGGDGRAATSEALKQHLGQIVRWLGEPPDSRCEHCGKSAADFENHHTIGLTELWEHRKKCPEVSQKRKREEVVGAVEIKRLAHTSDESQQGNPDAAPTQAGAKGEAQAEAEAASMELDLVQESDGGEIAAAAAAAAAILPLVAAQEGMRQQPREASHGPRPEEVLTGEEKTVLTGDGVETVALTVAAVPESLSAEAAATQAAM